MNAPLAQSILDSLDSRIAVIDGDGAILEANPSWERFDTARSELGLGSAKVGSNFLEILREAARGGRAFAPEGLKGIASVIARERTFASLDYQVETPSGTRWFRVCATPLEGSERGAVLSHAETTERMSALVELEVAHERQRNLSSRLLSAQEDERRRIAGELHDDIGQSLTALKITLHRLAARTPVEARPLIDEGLRVTDDTLERLRLLIHDLRPPQLDALGLVDALGWLVERQRDATGTDIRFSFSGVEEHRPPPDIEVACFRVAQEGLSNATQHAKASMILVKLAYEDPLLKLVIQDDGAGFDEAAGRRSAIQSGSLGLVGMEERARLVGGRVRLTTAPGAGTTLSAQFPYRHANPAG
ncbi:hypothetical protein DSM104443_02231 [Usitatibacter rugosus]|uniref:histidine kinase n=1 Tax=Usitatibacter rugosus TaxID=2732067 RepID=A0A6M4GV49_9PROT|nr:PAS domain-containing sensor histidine kinase [Usitatibacter rugosus]QJR11159.1 hypothetical protein DSM104443_02231 [Usitatibacter rugosus]